MQSPKVSALLSGCARKGSTSTWTWWFRCKDLQSWKRNCSSGKHFVHT